MSRAEKAAHRREIEAAEHPPVESLPPVYMGEQRPVIRGAKQPPGMER